MGEDTHIQSGGICPNNLFGSIHYEAPVQEWLNTCLLTETGQLIPCFSLLADTTFAFPIKLSISIDEFFHFYPLDSLSSHQGEMNKQLGGALLIAGVEPHHR